MAGLRPLIDTVPRGNFLKYAHVGPEILTRRLIARLAVSTEPLMYIMRSIKLIQVEKSHD